MMELYTFPIVIVTINDP